jgi:hypothetical protein
MRSALPPLAQSREENAAWETGLDLLSRNSKDLLVRRIFPEQVVGNVLSLANKYATFEDVLGSLPQTLCHGDANPLNLFARRGSDGKDETVVVDWSSTGLFPLGMELVVLVGGSIVQQLFPAAEARALDRLVYPVYLAGLRDANWQGDPNVVRLGYAAGQVAVCLKQAVDLVVWLLDEHRKAELADVPTQESQWQSIPNRAARIRFGLAYADEARELLAVVR